ncbi:hypothetical protein HK101_003447 [Irineochytrium annulatum]|nr:hypothetical protein HK101_003447 [Irineochytrium annulatum]
MAASSVATAASSSPASKYQQQLQQPVQMRRDSIPATSTASLSTSSSGTSKPLAQIPLAEIRRRCDGDKEVLIIFSNKVYNLTKWVKHHPGGDLAILHMNGRDATDVILAYHPDWAIEKKMPHFCIGELPASDILNPALTTPESKRVSTSYRLLDARIRRMGLYKTDFGFYFQEALKFLVIWVSAITIALLWPSSTIAVLTSAFLCATLWQQAAFVAHDAGHSGITHDAWTDTVFGVCLGNFLGGVSLGWWKKNHNVHHIVTNHPEHDPDIQHMPFLAVTARFAESLHSTYYKRTMDFDALARTMVPLQHYLFYVLLCFGRFNLYVNSWQHVLGKGAVPHRRLEMAGLVFFLIWYGSLMSRLGSWQLVVAHIMVSHMATMILHVQITLSHFGMDTSVQEGETYAEMALRTSMDVECPTWMDWFHGGLQFQVEHHLFPRVPRHNLRLIKPLVQEFARENGLEFHSFTFTEGNKFVIRHLRTVAGQIKALVSAGVGVGTKMD